jgi:hypothetical protein
MEGLVGVTPWFVECRVPREILLARGRSRDLTSNASDAHAGVVAREATVWDALDEIDADQHCIVRTDRPVDHVLHEIAGSTPSLRA